MMWPGSRTGSNRHRLTRNLRRRKQGVVTFPRAILGGVIEIDARASAVVLARRVDGGGILETTQVLCYRFSCEDICRGPPCAGNGTGRNTQRYCRSESREMALGG